MAVPEILLIDHQQAGVEPVLTVLAFLEYGVSCATDENYAEILADNPHFEVIFLVGSSSSTLINDVCKLADGIPVFLLINKGQTIPQTTDQFSLGVLEWPTTYPVLSALFQHLPQQPKSVSNKSAHKGLAGGSKAIQKIRNLIDQVAKSDATVLILGESGTGKEVIAQALHRASARKDKAFVAINCGAIPGELLESELFGHEKGAFTGALTARQGRFEMAEGGTLFLDEIGDMPLPMQVKLLRVLQERTFERVGSNKTIHCDVRVIAATHRQLEQEIAEKRFREDLFYRLNVFPIEVPALRDRAEDIPYLINDLNARMIQAQRPFINFTPEAIAVLMQHPWPGNVRELANLLERLAILNPDAVIDVANLPEKFQGYSIPDSMPNLTLALDLGENNQQLILPPAKLAVEELGKVQLPEQGIDLKEYLTDLENELIRQALSECNGVVAHAAKLLNMRRTTLVEKLRKVDG